MKSLNKLGKYHNLDKLKQIAANPCYTAKFCKKHNYIDPLHDDSEYSYTLWGTLGVKWHFDDIHENRKYSIILVIQSDSYELYASTINHDALKKFLKIDATLENQVNSLLPQRKDTQRLILKTGDIFRNFFKAS